MAVSGSVIRTARLLLRPLGPADLDALAVLLGDRESLALWGEPLDRAGAAAWIARNRARYEADGFGRCAIVLRQTGELIGDCGLARTEVEGRAEVELGWIVAGSHQGRGIATEAATAWRDHAFGSLGLTRIVSMISEENVASRRVAEKLGMRDEGPARWHGVPMRRWALQRPQEGGDRGGDEHRDEHGRPQHHGEPRGGQAAGARVEHE